MYFLSAKSIEAYTISES